MPKKVFVVHRDHALVSDLCATITMTGADVMYFSTPQIAYGSIHLRPEVILLGMRFSDARMSAQGLMQNYKAKYLRVTVDNVELDASDCFGNKIYNITDTSKILKALKDCD